MSKERRIPEQKQDVNRSKFFMTLNEQKSAAIADYHQFQDLEQRVLEAEGHGLLVKYFITTDGRLGATFEDKKQIGFV